ncbi:MAG: GNAT family N-acetyltransferase [Clostridia bacterium]|nr:GNAT family N-acetyltransferase [Clostridia bacterium]
MLLKITEYAGLDERKLMDVYSESNSENTDYFYPDEADKQAAVRMVEAGFLDFLKNDFFHQPEAAYWVLDENGEWVSALRICRAPDGPLYLEALETRPDKRGRGFAVRLLSGVIDALKEEGPFRLCDCVGKRNAASIRTHESCGFKIVSQAGYDHLSGTADERDYGFEYSWPDLPAACDVDARHKETNEELLGFFVEGAKAVLGDDLVGIYLHGSSVMGCYNPEKSDVDLIVVVGEPLSDAAKRAFMEMVMAANALGPKKGIEMSVVTKDVCRPFVYPTPYELHYSIGHLDRYLADPEAYISEMHGVDWDLAAHFTVIRARGRRLFGAPIEEVFAEVPMEDYMDSIWRDVADAKREIAKYPMYLILNLTRVLAYKEEGLVLSKKEGAEWAADKLPAEFLPLVRAALEEYTGSGDYEYDTDCAERYAEYMLRRISADSEL